MDTLSRVAHGYAFDFLGGINNDWYLWNLGPVSAVGPESHPIKPINELDKHSALHRDETTPDALADRTPDSTTTVEFFEHDWTVYLLTPTRTPAEYLVNPDTEQLYKIEGTVTIDGADGVVVRAVRRRNRFKEAITLEELDQRVEDGWQPVVRFTN